MRLTPIQNWWILKVRHCVSVSTSSICPITHNLFRQFWNVTFNLIFCNLVLFLFYGTPSYSSSSGSGLWLFWLSSVSSPEELSRAQLTIFKRREELWENICPVPTPAVACPNLNSSNRPNPNTEWLKLTETAERSIYATSWDGGGALIGLDPFKLSTVLSTSSAVVELKIHSSPNGRVQAETPEYNSFSIGKVLSEL